MPSALWSTETTPFSIATADGGQWAIRNVRNTITYCPFTDWTHRMTIETHHKMLKKTFKIQNTLWHCKMYLWLKFHGLTCNLNWKIKYCSVTIQLFSMQNLICIYITIHMYKIYVRELKTGLIFLFFEYYGGFHLQSSDPASTEAVCHKGLH